MVRHAPGWGTTVLYQVRRAEVRLVACEGEAPKASLRTPAEVADAIRPHVEGFPVEVAIVAHVDGRHKIVRIEEVARGAGNVVHVAPCDVFRGAIVAGASAIVFAHNHPSGDPQPSVEDDELTRRLVAAGALLGIQVIDHIVFGAGEKFYSYAVEGSGEVRRDG